jgi:hypothetical protein
MSALASQVDEVKALLVELVAETKELKRATGDSITEVMADWVAA